MFLIWKNCLNWKAQAYVPKTIGKDSLTQLK